MSRSDYADPAVLRYVMQFMQPDNALALEVSLQTGLRIDDVLSARTCDLSGRTLTVTEEKTGKRASKSVSSAAAERLRRNASASRLFPPRKRGKVRTQHKTRQAVYADLRKAAAKAGVSAHISPHTARKSYAVGVYRSGGLNAVREALNHDRDVTSMIYALSDKLTNGEKIEQPVEPESVDFGQFFAKCELKAAEILQKLDRIELLLKKGLDN